MDDIDKHKLAIEVSVGEQHQASWDAFVEPYFEHMTSELFEAFKTAPSDDPNVLTMIRLQVNALEGLRNHFMSYINSGKLASQALTAESK